MQEPNSPKDYEGFTTRRTELTRSARNRLQQRSLPCKFHPSNSLHTFCLSPECMLPMCSSCISIHNDDHQEARTHGNYRNLQQLISNTVQALDEQASVVEELCNQYVQDYQEKVAGLDKCKETMYKARVKAHEEIDRIFDRYTIDIEEKVNHFTDQLHELYNSLEERIHQTYKRLTKQKSDLSLYLQAQPSLSSPSSSSSLLKNPQTKRSQIHTFTPNNTNFNYLKPSDENQLRKEDRKILKTLIEYHSHSGNQMNYAIIQKLKKEIHQLKGFNFELSVNWQKMGRFLNNLCRDTIEVRSSAEEGIKKIKKEVNFAINQSPMGSQSSIQGGSKEEIIEIMRNTRERMHKMQLSGNTNGYKESPGREKLPQAFNRPQRM